MLSMTAKKVFSSMWQHVNINVNVKDYEVENDLLRVNLYVNVKDVKGKIRSLPFHFLPSGRPLLGSAT